MTQHFKNAKVSLYEYSDFREMNNILLSNKEAGSSYIGTYVYAISTLFEFLKMK